MPSASFAPLRHRSFALALSSNFVSSTGTWMQSVALGVYLTQRTHDALWLGLLTVAIWAPSVIGSPLGGIVADRWNRQRWIQANNLLMAAEATTLAVLSLTGHLTPRETVVLGVIEGFAGSTSWAAWNSLLPDLVERDEVLAAVSLGSAQFNLGRILGPVAAGVALAAGSPGVCFAANAASFVVVVITFAFVRSPHRAPVTTKVRPWAELMVGARAAWRVRGCRYPIIGVALVGVTLSPFIALVPAMAIEVLHAGKVGVSWMVTAQGVGAVLGALALPGLARRTSRVAVLRASLIAAVVAAVLYSRAPNLPLALAALLVLGAAYVGALTGLNTTVQLQAPTGERSRILSLYTLSLSLSYPLGALVQSALARTWGVRTVTMIGAVALAVLLGAVSASRARVWPEFASREPHVASLLAD